MVSTTDRPRSVVVVGASLAGFRTVKALRQRGYTGRLVLVGDEPHLPYDRPPLSKQVLTGAWPRERAALVDRPGLAALDVDVRLGVPATAALPGRVVLGDGSELEHDALVVATGACPRALPDQPASPRVLVLRRLEDSARLRSQLQVGRSLLVVGAGLIGGEVAAAARTAGVEVTVVEAQELPFARSLGPCAGARVAALHAANGVDLRTSTTVTGWEAAADGVGAELSDGSTLRVDAVLVGIGVRPNSDWLASTGLDLSDGVACDPYGRALGAEGVFAVGDVAAWQDVVTGRPRRSEHWTSAVEQAEVVADTLLGLQAPDPSSRLPYVWTDQYTTKVQVLGQTSGPGTTVELNDGAQGLHGTCLGRFHQGRLVGVTVFGAPRLLGRLRPLVAAGVDPATAVAASGALARA